MKKKQVIALLTATLVTLSGCGSASHLSAPAESAQATNRSTATVTDEAPTEEYYAEYADAPAVKEECEAPVVEYADSYYDTAADNSMAGLDTYYEDTATEEAYEYDNLADDDNDYSMDELMNKRNAEDESYLNSLYKNSKASTNNEEYSNLEEIGFKDARRQPASTFAADVDTASYSNLRRLIYDYGYTFDTLPENSVRIEEMLNYFKYSYKGPKGNEPFGVNMEYDTCPWNEDAMLLSIGLKTEDIDITDTPPSNIVFLIDVSGSMYDEDKLPLLQKSFCMLTDQLTGKDRVSIVTYAGSDSVVLEGARGSEKSTIKEALYSLNAGGSTHGSAGIRHAYEIAEDNFIKGGNNRVILATDGDLNVGLTSEDELTRLISREKESGVYLSVLGFGSGNIKDNKMEALADNGNGNYSFIDSEKEAKKVLVEELSSTILTVCKDTKLQVEFDPENVIGYRLIGYSNRVMSNKDFNDDKKDGGEIGAGHEVTALYEIIPTRESSSNLGELRIRFKRPDGDTSELLTYPINLRNTVNKPSDNIRFQEAVAEFGLLASNSEYAEDADIENVISTLKSVALDDENKLEFYDIVKRAR